MKGRGQAGERSATSEPRSTAAGSGHPLHRARWDLLGATVGDIMVEKVFSLSPQETLLTAASDLRQHRFTGAPVVENGRLVGVISQKDILRRIERETLINTRGSLLDLFLEKMDAQHLEEISRCREVLSRTTVQEVMAQKVVTVAPTLPLDELVRTMTSSHIHRVPVVEGGRLVGIVTRNDILEILSRIERETPPAPSGRG